MRARKRKSSCENSSSVSSVASSAHMSVIAVMDLIFSLSSSPLKSMVEPFGKSIDSVVRFIAQYVMMRH